MNKQKKRLLIIEDEEIFCHFLQECLQHYGYQTDALLNGEGIPGLLEQYCFNLIILDILLPGKDGFYWLKWIRQYYPNIPIILMSSKTTASERLEGMEKGAQDYLPKPFHDRELMIRINNILKNHMIDHHSKHIHQLGELTLDTVNNCIHKKGHKIKLTELECKILQLLYINTGIPLSRNEIMEQTMGISYHPPNRSIDTHINRLRNKIEDTPSKPVYLRTIRGRGYCLHLPKES